jgi:hypothetical protein
MFTSRSVVEAYQDCPRLRYNNYHLLGKGVVGVSKSVPLVTGSAVHRGVEHLLNRVRIGQEPDIETAVHLAVEQYVKDVEGVGFSGKNLQTDKQQWFTFNEQKALVEGLVRAWYIVELPRLVERYKVLAVERDIEPIVISYDYNILFHQAKVDAEFQEIATGDYVNYSLKTTKQWSERNEENYKSDLQGVTEIWAMEEDAKRENNRLDEMLALVNKLYEGDNSKYAQFTTVKAYLAKRKQDKKISAIRFCYLVKGIRKTPDYYSQDPEALMITYSPLIRGYKNFTPGGVSYAHSWFYPNPNNKSGKSILGKGWEPFNVWEAMGVKEWMEMLPQLQPECGDIIKSQVVTPVEYFRSEAEIKEAIAEIKVLELRLSRGLFNIESKNSCDNPEAEEFRILTDYFPHNRKHCYFHFGYKCSYLPLCWQPEVAADPIGSGLYQIREAHHEAERNS